MQIGLTPGLLQVLGSPAQPAPRPPGEAAQPASREAAVRPRVEQPARAAEATPASGARPAPYAGRTSGEGSVGPGPDARIDLLV